MKEIWFRLVSLAYKCLSSFFSLAVTLFLCGGVLNAQELTDPLIKTGLLHKFAQHIEWPQEEDIDTFRIGMYGQEPELLSNLLLLESVELKGRPVSIKHFTRLGDISDTHLLYIARENNSEMGRIADRIEGILFDSLRRANFTLSQLTNTNIIVLKNLQGIIDRVRERRRRGKARRRPRRRQPSRLCRPCRCRIE